MRRSERKKAELVAARLVDFIEGNASEAVTRASLKALDQDPSEIELFLEQASSRKIQQREDFEVTRIKAGMSFIDKYLGR